MPYSSPIDWIDDVPPGTSTTPLNDTNISAMETALALFATQGEGRINATPVASATSIDPPDGYRFHTISGTTTIQTIVAQTAGQVITLWFSGEAASVGLETDTGNLLLERSFAWQVNDSITLASNGTSWLELGRSSAADEQAQLDQASVIAAKANSTLLSDSGMGYVNHGSTAGAARPTGYAAITWVGSVQPDNAVDGDVWVDTT
jgi:hypothetical protein